MATRREVLGGLALSGVTAYGAYEAWRRNQTVGGGGGNVGPEPSSELLIETGEEYRIESDESETHLAVRNEPDSELTIEAGGELVLEAI